MAARSGTRTEIIVPRRTRIDGFDLVVLSAFAGVSLWVLALDLWQVIAHGRVWTGTDGVYLVDQMQYLAWISDSSRHALASNLFVLRDTPADYLQPAVVLSGAISALGVAPWLSLLLWKPVAVGGAFYATREYVHGSLGGAGARRVALVLGLFFASFSVIYGSFGVVGDLFPGFLLWGYPFGLLALAAMLLALLAYERGRAAGRFVLAPALLGALASSLHPWQGELLILTVIGAELQFWRRPLDRGAGRGLGPWVWGRLAGGGRLPAVTVVVTALPLAYYAVLGQTDLSWRFAREASKHSFSLGTIVLGLAPLGLVAAFGYRGRPRSFLAAATRSWPIAALVVYLVSATGVSATPLHAFEGITIPLAVLAVGAVRRGGWDRLPRHRLLAWIAVGAATIPGGCYALISARTLVAPAGGNANFITAQEHDALHYLARSSEPGGVITRFYLGSLIPGASARRTFVGDCLWSTPQCTPRAKAAQALFDGSLGPTAARALVLLSGARFVLADCQAAPGLAALLHPITRSVHRFGCAAVYGVD
ncbi:MAG: hypothetical protein ACR2OB_10605 [Solirubrobacteraceae bacterium]